jgi:nucleoid DNA-binding protein
MQINDEIYRQIAKEQNIKLDDVEDVCKSMFSFIYDIMDTHTYQPIRLPYFGVFMCKPERLKKLGLKINGNEQ